MPPPDALQLQLPLPQPQPGSERQATLADQLCDLLVRRGRSLEVGHVVAQVLRVRRCPEKLQRRLVAEIVDSDSRLSWRGRDLVGLAPLGWAATPLRDATFCVVDLETTGGAPGRSKITEIGAVRVRGGEIIDRFTTLVAPGIAIPAPIVRVTGITDAMLVGQPRIEEVMERFIAFVGDDVMVAHNAPFDFRFLNYERFRLNGTYFTQPWLDTLVLARRLLKRRLDRFDLGTLAEWADTTVRPNHRALADAEATGEVLTILLGLLADRGYATLDRAVGYGQGGGARYAHKLALADDLPRLPGVYLMRDREGAVLYVGKARDLRRRVRSYFGPQGRHSRLVARALEAVATIDHETTGSELRALVEEARLIRELRPPCNSRGGSTAGRYLKLTIDEAYPRLLVVAEPVGDGAMYYGPLRSERTARQAVEALNILYPIRSCHTLCAGGAQERLIGEARSPCCGPCGAADPAGYREAVDEVRRLLDGDRHMASAILMARLARAMADGAIIANAEWREQLEGLIAVVGALSRIRSALSSTAVIAEPDVSTGTVYVMFVGHGRIVREAHLSLGDVDELASAVSALHELPATPPSLSRADLDEALILDDWMRARVDHPGVVVFPPGFDPDEVVAHVHAVVAALGASDGETLATAA